MLRVKFSLVLGVNKPIWMLKFLSEVPDNYQSFSQFEKDSDTLNYWFTPVEKDSLTFIVSNKEIKDTTTVFLERKRLIL